MGIREIHRRLKLSRNTVRAIIAKQGTMAREIRSDKVALDPELLLRLYRECEGRMQRVHEKLLEEEGLPVCYSTLTRICREQELSTPVATRCDRRSDEPGAEMQHDTSSYRVRLGGMLQPVVASVLYLRYSKRRYLRFYLKFNRFNMKCFFHEALSYWGHAAPECIIDNTNLARHSGAGRHAVIAPEMVAFSGQYGFHFRCHEIGHANRKAGEERSFYTVETNFLAGRTFLDLADLNRQALQWATERMELRPQTKARIIPAEAFLIERPSLVVVPPGLPAPYLPHTRLVDQYGYIAFGANYYWVWGEKRGDVTLLEYADRLKIYRGRELIMEYPVPAAGVRNERFSPEEMPEPRYQPKNRKRPTGEEEKLLRELDPLVCRYLDQVLPPAGIKRHYFIRRLLSLSQRMTREHFLKSVERGLKFGVTEISAIERIAQLLLGKTDVSLVEMDLEDGFRERASYREGEVTDLPDLKDYEEENDDGREDDDHAEGTAPARTP